jgi:cyclophilin family peptidyl-prolyl cis-trans isomerase
MKRSGSICSALGLATFVLLATGPVRSAEEKKAGGEAAGKVSPPASTGAKAEGKEKAVSENEIAVIETNLGTIKVKFFPDAAPKAVENFKGLAKKGYYNGIIFHRVIDAFMIQGGDPTGTGRGGQSLWGKAFEDEFSPKYRFDRKGLLAMANAGPKTNGSQFFITLVPTPHLNNRHTIFGEVISGMDVVDKIGKVPVGAGSKPLEPVTMKKVTIEAAAAAEKALKEAPKPETKIAPKDTAK